MLTFTLDADHGTIQPGITVQRYTVGEQDFVGVDVGYFSKKLESQTQPCLRIFRIRYANPGDNVLYVMTNSRPARNESESPQLFGAYAQRKNLPTDSALLYIKTQDPERRVRIQDGKKHYLEGALYEGTIESEVEHTTSTGTTYKNKGNPAVLRMEQDREYVIQYFDNNQPHLLTISFNGTEVVILSDKLRAKAPRPFRKTKYSRAQVTSTIADALYTSPQNQEAIANIVDTWKESRNRKHKKNSSVPSRKEQRWQ